MSSSDPTNLITIANDERVMRAFVTDNDETSSPTDTRRKRAEVSSSIQKPQRTNSQLGKSRRPKVNENNNMSTLGAVDMPSGHDKKKGSKTKAVDIQSHSDVNSALLPWVYPGGLSRVLI
jgi:hypothetical protein